MKYNQEQGSNQCKGRSRQYNIAMRNKQMKNNTKNGEKNGNDSRKPNLGSPGEESIEKSWKRKYNIPRIKIRKLWIEGWDLRLVEPNMAVGLSLIGDQQESAKGRSDRIEAIRRRGFFSLPPALRRSLAGEKAWLGLLTTLTDCPSIRYKPTLVKARPDLWIRSVYWFFRAALRHKFICIGILMCQTH